MKEYSITLKDETTYTIETKSEEEAIDKALEYWEHRMPTIDIKEKKKVKRIVHYAVTNYYKQDVLVDEDLDVDEIRDLWNDDNIEISSEPVPENNVCNSEIDYNSIWVE